MALMLGPTDFGLPSFIPQPTTPIGQSIVKALMAKHGINIPAAGPAPNTAPQVGPENMGSDPVGVKAGADVAALPTMGVDAPATAPAELSSPAGSSALASLSSGSVKAPGLLDRINGFLKSDDGRATMMRFAAGAANGGLGGGLGAATAFADQRRREQAASADEATQNAFKTRELGDNEKWRLGELNNQGEQNLETSRHNRAEESVQGAGIISENYRHATPSGDTLASQSGEDRRTAAQIGERQFEHINPSGDTTATQAGETYREQNPVATPAPVRPNTISLHAHYTTTPQEFAANGPRLRPSEIKPDMSGGATKISSDAEYQSLPSGARFMGPDGQVRIKP